MKPLLKNRSDLHIARKIWHVLGLLFIVSLYTQVSHSLAKQLITFFTLLFVINDILRQQIPALNKVLITIFHPIMRESERHTMAGTSYLLMGTFVVIFFFNSNITILTLLLLAIADPLASYVGILYGQDKLIGEKSLQGFLAAFFACTFISAVFYFSQNLMIERLLIVSVLSGLIGAFSELIPIGKIDDNLSFPVICALSLWGLFSIFGGL